MTGRGRVTSIHQHSLLARKKTASAMASQRSFQETDSCKSCLQGSYQEWLNIKTISLHIKEVKKINLLVIYLSTPDSRCAQGPAADLEAEPECPKLQSGLSWDLYHLPNSHLDFGFAPSLPVFQNFKYRIWIWAHSSLKCLITLLYQH